MSDTIHRIITERMLAALERGTIPWRKPWHAEGGRPLSMSSGQPYRGVNVFLLGLTAAEEGYASPHWGTYRQISDLGGQVRKGERSTFVIFWKQAEHTEPDPQTGEITTRRLPVLRYYRVFNAAQADHLPGRFYPSFGQDTEIAEPQAVLDSYLADGPRLRHLPGDRAAYNPATDTIQLPLRTQFRAPEHYYATAFHEAGHSTGHPQRLNRAGIADFDHFGSGRYAKEELIAQMTSSLLCAQTGIENPEIFDESASYIAGWLHALNEDKRLVITAAAHAQRASDLIAEPQHQGTRDTEHPRNSLAHPQLIDDSERDGPAPDGRHVRRPSEPHAQPGPSEAAERSSDWQAEAG
jgi:antirestriction protein ArdC